MNLTLILLLSLFFSLTASFPRKIALRKPHNGRIIGGADARAGEFPFAAAIYLKTGDGTYFCGGSLVNNRFLLTAGNCVVGAVSFNILLGSNKLNETNLQLSTSEYASHPDFNADSFVADIGVIKFRLAIDFSIYITSIALPVHDLDNYSAVFGLGWGQTSDSQSGLTNHLQFVAVFSLPHSECVRSFPSSPITEQMVCVQGSYNQGACNGDHGGPLILYQHRYPVWVVGVASFVGPDGCETQEPSGYTRVYPYVDWIKNAISNT